jgi:hypothetical protein
MRNFKFPIIFFAIVPLLTRFTECVTSCIVAYFATDVQPLDSFAVTYDDTRVNKHKKFQPSIVGVNVLGVFGYMLVLTAWVLLVAVIVALLMQRNIVVLPEVITDTPPAASSPISGLTVGFASVVTAIMVLATLVVLIVFPYLVGKWSSRTLRRLSLLVKISPTKRHMFLVKGLVATIPLLGFLIIALVARDVTLTFAIVYSATVIASVVAIMFFFVQLLLARAFRLSDENVW